MIYSILESAVRPEWYSWVHSTHRYYESYSVISVGVPKYEWNPCGLDMCTRIGLIWSPICLVLNDEYRFHGGAVWKCASTFWSYDFEIWHWRKPSGQHMAASCLLYSGNSGLDIELGSALYCRSKWKASTSWNLEGSLPVSVFVRLGKTLAHLWFTQPSSTDERKEWLTDEFILCRLLVPCRWSLWSVLSNVLLYFCIEMECCHAAQDNFKP